MSLTIDKIHDRILFLAKKNQWGYISHEQIDIVLDMAQMELYEEYYGDINKYQPGRPVPIVAYDQTKKVSESLGRFIHSIQISVATAPLGRIEYPADFRSYVDSHIIYTDGGNDHYVGLEFMSQGQKAMALNSQLLPQSSDASAFITFEAEGFQIYPKKTFTGEFRYLRLPSRPQFSYTSSGRSVTYVSGTSTQLEWGDDDIHKIIIKALTYLGIPLEDYNMYNQAQTKDKQ